MNNNMSKGKRKILITIPFYIFIILIFFSHCSKINWVEAIEHYTKVTYPTCNFFQQNDS